MVQFYISGIGVATKVTCEDNRASPLEARSKLVWFIDDWPSVLFIIPPIIKISAACLKSPVSK